MRLETFLLLAIASIVRCKYWLEEIEHRGTSPYYPDAQYRVFRNVKDYGAVGDGSKMLHVLLPSSQLTD